MSCQIPLDNSVCTMYISILTTFFWSRLIWFKLEILFLFLVGVLIQSMYNSINLYFFVTVEAQVIEETPFPCMKVPLEVTGDERMDWGTVKY